MQAELLGVESSAAAWRARLSRVAPALLLAGSRCGGVALQFLLQVVVGGMAGPAGLGVLQLFASWSSMLGEGLARGLPAWAMRIVAVDTTRDDPARARHDLQWAVRRIVLLALAVGLVAGLALVLAGAWLPPDYYRIAQAVILAAPLFALLRLGAEALKGAGQALLAVSIENLVLPAVVLVVCLICWLLGQGLELPVLLCAGVGGMAAALWAVWKAMPVPLQPVSKQRQAPTAPCHDTADVNALWANSLLAVAFLQLPFLLMPWFAAPEEIGI